MPLDCGAGWYPARDPEGTPATGACWPVYRVFGRVINPPDPEGTHADLPHNFCNHCTVHSAEGTAWVTTAAMAAASDAATRSCSSAVIWWKSGRMMVRS